MLNHNHSVGKCHISRSPCVTMSITNKYLVLMCLVRLELEKFQFFSKHMALFVGNVVKVGLKNEGVKSILETEG